MHNQYARYRETDLFIYMYPNLRANRRRNVSNLLGFGSGCLFGITESVFPMFIHWKVNYLLRKYNSLMPHLKSGNKHQVIHVNSHYYSIKWILVSHPPEHILVWSFWYQCDWLVLFVLSIVKVFINVTTERPICPYWMVKCIALPVIWRCLDVLEYTIPE